MNKRLPVLGLGNLKRACRSDYLKMNDVCVQYKHVVQTVLQRLILMQDREGLPVLRRRQKSAFPPNYVHSLDSTHMMMTALACKQAGARSCPDFV